jgi:hypothetical protein
MKQLQTMKKDYELSVETLGILVEILEEEKIIARKDNNKIALRSITRELMVTIAKQDTYKIVLKDLENIEG